MNARAENQFSLTRAASGKCLREKSNCLSGISQCLAITVCTFLVTTALVGQESTAREKALARARAHNPAEFDLSGFPAKPATAEEKQIAARINAARTTASEAHELLATYYAEKGDAARADAERTKAEFWRRSKSGPAAAKAPLASETSTARDKSVAAPTTFSGSFYGTSDDGWQHQWTFMTNGIFLHRVLGGGFGRSDRGTFTLSGERLEVIQTNSASAYTSPSAQYGANAAARKTNVMTLKLKGPNGENGIILDGMGMAVKHWN
jgi:hypothetical protein